MTTTPQKITFGEMRASGVRDVLIYCRDHRCSHHVETNADGLADDVRLSDIEPSFTVHAAAKKARRCGRSSRTLAWGPAEVPWVRAVLDPIILPCGPCELSDRLRYLRERIVFARTPLG